MCSIFGSHSNQSGSSNTQSSSASTPIVPQDWLARYTATGGGLNAYGMTPDQQFGADWLRNNIMNNPMGGAYDRSNAATDAAGNRINQGDTQYGNMPMTGINRIQSGDAAGSGAVNSGLHYLESNQDIGSNTLGHWFAGQDPNIAAATAAGGPAVNGASGANFSSPYMTSYLSGVVDPSLADYDNGVANGFAALKGAHAGAFGNDRTGIAESQYLSDAARGRASLAAGLRSGAFTTATGYGMSDADRAQQAGTTNLLASNDLSKFNAGQLQSASAGNAALTNNRQQFDINQADVGDQTRLGIANNIAGLGTQQINNGIAVGDSVGNLGTQGVNNGINVGTAGAGVGAQGVNTAINFNTAGVGNANALGNFGNMSMAQLFQLLGIGTNTFGQSNTGNSATQTKGSSTSFGAGASFKV